MWKTTYVEISGESRNAIGNTSRPVDRERLARYETRAVPGQPRVRHGGPSRLETWRQLVGTTQSSVGASRAAGMFRLQAQAEADDWTRTWGTWRA